MRPPGRLEAPWWSPRTPSWCHASVAGEHRWRGVLTPAVGDGQPAVPSERLVRDLRPGRVLPPLELGDVGEPEHLLDQLAVEPCGEQLGGPAVLLHVVVEHVV